MSNSEQKATVEKTAADKTETKPDFTSFIRIVEPDAMNPPANESEQAKGEGRPKIFYRPVRKPEQTLSNVRILQITGLLISAMWLAGAGMYVQRMVGWQNVSNLMPHELGGFLAGILSPIALFWMIAAFILRSNDVKMYAEALREEIQAMIFPSEEADRRVNNDIQRLMRQTAEMSKATKIMIATINEVRGGLKSQVDDLTNSGDATVQRLKGLSDLLTERTNHVKQAGADLSKTAREIDRGTDVTNAWVERMETVNRRLEAQTTMVDHTTQNTEQSITRMGKMLQSRLESMTSFHQKTEDALHHAAEVLETQRHKVQVESTAIEDSARTIAHSMEKGVQSLYGFTDDALDKAKLIETRLQGQAASLENIVTLTNDSADTLATRMAGAIAQLDQANSDAVNASQKFAGEVEQVAGRVQQVLTTETDRLISRVETAGDTMQKTVFDTANRVEGDMNAATQRLQDVIAKNADAVANNGKTVGETTQQIVSQTTARLVEQAMRTINTAQQDLQNATSGLVTQTEESGVKFAASIAQNTDQMTQSAQHAMAMVEDKLHATSSRLVGEMDDIATRAQTVGETTQQLVSDTTASLVEHAMRAINMAQKDLQNATSSWLSQTEESGAKFTASIAQNTDQVAQSAQHVLAMVEDKLAATSSRLVGEMDGIAARTQTIEETTQQLVSETTASVVEHAMRAIKAVQQDLQTTTSGLLTQTEEGSAQFAASITQNADRAAQSAQQAMVMVDEKLNATSDRIVGDMDGIAMRAKTISDNMMAQIGNKIADTSASFVYIQKQIQALVTLFDERKQHLDEAGSDARQTAETLQKTLQGVIDKVRDTSSHLNKDIGAIEAMVQKPIAQLETTMSAAETRAASMANMMQGKNDNLLQIAAQIDAQVAAMHDRLASKGSDMATQAAQIAGSLQNVGATLDNQHEALTQQTDRSTAALQKLAELQQTLHGDFDRMGAHYDHVETQLQNVQAAHIALSTDAVQAQSHLGQLSDRLIHITGDTVAQVRETLDKISVIEGDYVRLENASMETLGRIGDSYRQAFDTVRHDAQALNDNVLGQQQALHEQAQRLSGSIRNEAENITDAANTMQQTMQDFDQLATQTANHLDLVREVQNETRTQLHQLTDAAGGLNTMLTANHMAATQLHEQMRDVEERSTAAQTQIVQSTAALKEQGVDLQSLTASLTDHLATAHNTLNSHNAQLQQQGDDLLQRLQTALAQIANHGEALANAAGQAESQADRLQVQDAKLKREVFFNSAKFVLESLHSLSLDFTRLLDGELSEKTWKAYQKGDAASFTRRLLNARDEQTQEKIKRKFTEDAEFRTYVQRYLRQFEEMYDQAASNDHADLLASMLLGSEIGKLYLFLGTVLGRAVRSPDALKFAA